MTIGTLATSVDGDPVIVFDSTDAAWDTYRLLIDSDLHHFSFVCKYNGDQNAIQFPGAWISNPKVSWYEDIDLEN